MSDKLYQFRNDSRHIMESAAFQNATDFADSHLIEKALGRGFLRDLDRAACRVRGGVPAASFWQRVMPAVARLIDVEFAPAHRAVARLISRLWWQGFGQPRHSHPLGPHARCRKYPRSQGRRTGARRRARSAFSSSTKRTSVASCPVTGLLKSF